MAQPSGSAIGETRGFLCATFRRRQDALAFSCPAGWSSGGSTPKTAQYSAGTKTRVTSVPAMIPPIIAKAIGPQNTWREIGISARLAAAAVSRIGRARLSEASNTACHWL